MAVLNKSETELSEKNYWRTPQNLIDDALKLLNIESFDVDCCAKSNRERIRPSKYFISEESDALRDCNQWFVTTNNITSPSFCNPPFTLKWKFFQKGVEQVNKYKKNILFVLPYTPCSQEWAKYVHNANCVIYVPDGRYNFLLPDGSKPKNSCSFDVCLILLVPFKLGNVIVNYKRGK